MDELSLLEECREKDSLIVSIPRDIFPHAHASSWAVYGGGNTLPHAIVNHNCGDLDSNVDKYVSKFIEARGLPAESVIMLTAVSQKFQGSAEISYDGTAVRAYATVGIGNALAAGDPASSYLGRTGTINIIVIVPAMLSIGGLIEGIAIATEAKVQFLYDKGVESTVSRAMATGTGTDCITFVSLGVGNETRYAGKHLPLGQFIARAVTYAMEDSWNRRLRVHV